MRRQAVLAAIVLLCTSCRPSGDARLLERKCDPPLRQEVKTLARSGQPGVLVVFGKCSAPLDDRMKQQLAGAGAEVQTTTGAIFTARIPLERLADVARLAFVTQLELSKTAVPSRPE